MQLAAYGASTAVPTLVDSWKGTLMGSLTYAAEPISFLGVDADQWSLAAAVATTAGFAIGTVVAIVAVGQFLQSQRVHREQTRPFMIITAEPSPIDQTFVDLVVRNIGTTPAYDLTIAITPRIERVREESGYEVADARIFRETIAMWAPGYELRQWFDSHIERENVRKERAAAGEESPPEQFTARLTYYGSSRARWFRRRERWVEDQVIDIEIGKGTMYTDIYGIHHVAKSLREIGNMINKAKLGETPKHVVVEGREEYIGRVRADREKRKATLAERRARLIPEASAPEPPADTQ
ncbi:MAG: hypothetical protein JWQ43_3656 [Glaciihabitans sp.]|nr:hypothetical protein [Glaciihabitans sp.]